MQRAKRIMIADDDPGIVDSMSLMIEFMGFDVITTSDGASLLDPGLELPDLLLLDIWMSGVDGRNICRQLKRDERTRQLPVIMISASKDIEQSALESGADDFLAKPFEMDDLSVKINKLLLHQS